jgi:hypothetical protein
MNKYEQLIEHIINDETDKARELFHTIVVEKSRDIYESLIDEQDLAEVGGNEVEDLVDEISIDEQGISEEDEEMGDEPALDSEEPMGDEEDHHADVGGEEELEDRVVDLEDALDELKAEFDALMAGDDNAEAMPGDDDEMAEMHGGMSYDAMQEEEFYEAKHEDEEAEEVDEVDETIVREYVEKVATPANSEGAAVGAGKSVAVNKKSTVAGKNDMGGTAAFSKGGNADQDGNRPTATEKPKGTLVSNPQNKPGANAGKAFAKKETAVNAEVGGVNKTSPLAK